MPRQEMKTIRSKVYGLRLKQTWQLLVSTLPTIVRLLFCTCAFDFPLMQQQIQYGASNVWLCDALVRFPFGKKRVLLPHQLAAVANTSPGKSKIINKAIQDMGMGRYQWELFVLCGFGWFADKYVNPPSSWSTNELTRLQFLAAGMSLTHQ